MASRTFPGFSSIYVLEEGSHSAFRGVVSIEDDDAWRVLRAERTPSQPVEVRHAMGRTKPSDFIHTSSTRRIIISDRVLGILEGEGFSGWQTYPLHLYGKDGARIRGYHGLAVHGRCGPLDDSRSVRLDKSMPGGVFPAWYGLYFDPATWDGSDLFMTSSDQTWVFAVEAVKRVMEKAKVTNVMFEAADKVEVPRLD